MKRFWSSDEDGHITFHQTYGEAQSAARKLLSDLQDQANEGWPEGMENIGYGEVYESVRETLRLTHAEAEKRGIPMDSAIDSYVEYELLPETHRRDYVEAWRKFRDFGLLFAVNNFLRLFGWMIYQYSDPDTGEIVGGRPMRTNQRGFRTEVEEEGVRKFQRHLANNMHEVFEETMTNPERYGEPAWVDPDEQKVRVWTSTMTIARFKDDPKKD